MLALVAASANGPFDGVSTMIKDLISKLQESYQNSVDEHQTCTQENESHETHQEQFLKEITGLITSINNVGQKAADAGQVNQEFQNQLDEADGRKNEAETFLQEVTKYITLQF